MPRQLDDDARTLLDKKLHRVFAFLDQDYDGRISRGALQEVLGMFDTAATRPLKIRGSSKALQRLFKGVSLGFKG